MSNEHITIFFLFFNLVQKIYLRNSHYLQHARHFICLCFHHTCASFLCFSLACSSNCISFFGFLSLLLSECIVSFYDEHLIRNKFFIFIFNSSCAFVPVWSSFFQLSFTLHEVVKILTTNHLIFAVYDK